MMTTDEGRTPLEFLRKAVVSLAGARFEKYYHHSTCTHIVKQLQGTEFRGSGIKGCADFADEAYAAYRSALEAYVAQQGEERLRVLAGRLTGVAAVGARKIELQVQLPGKLAEEIDGRAKEMNIGMSAYLGALLDRCLPFDLDEAQIVSWAQKFETEVRPPEGPDSKRRTVFLPLEVEDVERIERITARLATRRFVSVPEFVAEAITALPSAAFRNAPEMRVH